MNGPKTTPPVLRSRDGAARYGWILAILAVVIVIAVLLFVPAWWPWSS